MESTYSRHGLQSEFARMILYGRVNEVQELTLSENMRTVFRNYWTSHNTART